MFSHWSQASNPRIVLLAVERASAWCAKTTVDSEFIANDKGRIVGREQGHCFGRIFGRSKISGRNGLDASRNHLFRGVVAFAQGCHDEAGAQRICTDAARTPFNGRVPREFKFAGFRGAVRERPFGEDAEIEEMFTMLPLP